MDIFPSRTKHPFIKTLLGQRSCVEWEIRDFMLVSESRQFAVCNLGWVDKGELWHYDCSSNVINTYQIRDAKYLKLYAGRNVQYFLVAHYFEQSRIEYTVHAFEDPSVVLAGACFEDQKISFEGDLDLFREFRRHFTTHLDAGTGARYQLVTIDPDVPTLTFDTFNWFDSSYDHIYQGIYDVYEHSSGNLIVTIVRDSNPVLYDPIQKTVVRKLKLAENHGNPTLYRLRKREEFWASDYDTLVKLDASTLEVKQIQEIQPGKKGVSYFIGNFTFSDDESLCYIARPYSGDIVVIDTEKMQIVGNAATGRQPLDAVLMQDNTFVARDWRTGDFLWAQLEDA